MNTGWFVLVIVLAWSALSIAVALAFGAMARARDVVPKTAGVRARDDGFRAAV